MLTHISLFSGIGGIDLAAEWAGFKTVLFVEIDPYCQKVLKKHWPDVPIIGDIRDVTKEAIAHSYQQGKSTLSFDGESGCRELAQGRSRNIKSPITLITGGFPCQPVSHAGKRRGTDDDRWLWPEMLRVISEVRPTWVVAENVAGLLNMGFNDCVSDLESQGYETIPFLIPACAVNAPHRRDRIFIVAHDNSIRCELQRLGGEGIQRGDKSCSETGASSEDVADTSSKGLQKSALTGLRFVSDQAGTPQGSESCRAITEGWNHWAVEPELGRVAHGIPHRVDRLRCLGNAVVPQQIYPILKAIADIESDNHNRA